MIRQESKTLARLAKLGFVAFGIIVFAAVIFPRVIMVIRARMVGRNKPELWVTPQPLAETSMSPPVGAPLTYAGLTFSAPWSGAEDKTRKLRAGEPTGLGPYALIHFARNVSVSIFNDPANLFADAYRKLKSSRYSGTVFDRADSATDYDWEQAMLSQTPGGVRFWASRANIGAASVLLWDKEIEFSAIKPHAVYSLTTPQFQGFQIDSPEMAKPAIDLNLYDEARSVKFWITFDPRAGANVKQADINLIVQTLRESGAPPATSTAAPAQIEKAR